MICTQCGTIYHDEDRHTCNPLNLPIKGKAKQPKTDTIDSVV